MDFRADSTMVVDDFLRHPAVQQRLDHGAVSLRLVTVHGEYLYASSGVKDLLGWTPQEFVQLDAWTLLHPEDVSEAQQFVVKLTTGQSIEAVVRARTRDAEYRWVRVRMAPFEEELAVEVRATDPPADGKARWRDGPSFLDD